MLESALILIFSLLLDQLIGEPRRYHPLVGFGWCVARLELMLNKASKSFDLRRLKGLLALLILIMPLLIIAQHLKQYFVQAQMPAALWWFFEIVIVYLAIGRKSLMQHARAVMQPLKDSDLETARTKLSYIVSRDTKNLKPQAIITATIESVIENSNDAIFAAIFWYLVAGLPGILCYRLVNTLDAMWGYKNERYFDFGWAAAKLDDVMNWVPARLTVLSFALLNSVASVNEVKRVISTAFEQGGLCSSPNAGPVMAAGASSLNVQLGGEAYYQQKLIAKPILGYGNQPEVTDIERAMKLVNKSVYLWCGVIALMSIFVILITEVN